MNQAPPTQPARSLSRPLVIALGVVVACVCVVIGFTIGAFLMLVNNGILNPSWTEENIRRSQQRGASLIAALDAYQSSHGVYPEQLAELLSEGLDDIPQPTAGVDRWSYASTEGGRGFVLQFSANRFNDPTSWYESRHQRWFIQDGEFSLDDDPRP